MEPKLSENIRAFRKARSLTQEQLAEAIGVSLGVISKWELGLSMPDAVMIMELAAFFGTSADLLIGYRVQDKTRTQILADLKRYVHDRDNPLPFDELEHVISRYINDFEIIYRCASLYAIRATPANDRRMNLRALELYELAARLINQNTDDGISPMSIQIDIANVYRSLHRYEEAIALLKKNSPHGIYDHLIGYVLACDCEKPDEAMEYLSTGLLNGIDILICVTTGYINAYMKQGRHQKLFEIADWGISLIESIRLPGKTGYLDKLIPAYLVAKAGAHLLLGERDTARDELRKAMSEALCFDAAPTYAANAIRFVELDAATSYDDFGDTSMNATDMLIAQQDIPELQTLWAETKNEA